MNQQAVPQGALTAHEGAYLKHLIQRAQNARQDDVLAALNPGDNMSRWMAGIPYVQTPVAEPLPWLAVDGQIGTEILDQTVNYLGVEANQTISRTVTFDVPTTIYALTGSAYSTSGTLTGQVSDARDTFRVQFRTTNGQLFQTTAALGSTIVGSGERPRKLGGACWRFNTGGSLVVEVTPLFANLSIDITLWAVRQPGPTNLTTG